MMDFRDTYIHVAARGSSRDAEPVIRLIDDWSSSDSFSPSGRFWATQNLLFTETYFAPSDLTVRLSGCFATTSGVHVRIASVSADLYGQSEGSHAFYAKEANSPHTKPIVMQVRSRYY